MWENTVFHSQEKVRFSLFDVTRNFKSKVT